MPTKALLYASDVLHLARTAGTWGLCVPEAGFDFSAVMARKNSMIREFTDDRIGQLTDGRFGLIRGTGRFVDPNTVQTSSGETIRAAHFVISTGSVVAPPPLAQLGSAGYLTSDDALMLDRLPKSLIVLGGGAVGVEFAQFFARFGVKVTLLQRGGHLLKDFDADAADVLMTVFVREGITVHTGTRLLDAGREGTARWVSFEQSGKPVGVTAEEILFALGRSPQTSSLNLGVAGVEMENGRILTDDRMQTSAAHIFAAGDCTSPYEIVHLAVQQGEIAAHNIAHPDQPRRIDYRLLTNVVFTDPQIATVGLTVKAAAAAGIPHLAASHPFVDHGKSLIMEARDGFVRLLANPNSGEIMGGCCVGPLGGELIHVIVAAMAKRMTVHELAAMPHYHPTLAEIWSYPAEELAGKIHVTR